MGHGPPDKAGRAELTRLDTLKPLSLENASLSLNPRFRGSWVTVGANEAQIIGRKVLGEDEVILPDNALEPSVVDGLIIRAKTPVSLYYLENEAITSFRFCCRCCCCCLNCYCYRYCYCYCCCCCCCRHHRCCFRRRCLYCCFCYLLIISVINHNEQKHSLYLIVKK